MRKSKPVIITCAITGSIRTPSMSPHFQLETNPAHSLGHESPVEVYQIADVNAFLTEQRQAIGIFRNRDLRQRRFGW